MKKLVNSLVIVLFYLVVMPLIAVENNYSFTTQVYDNRMALVGTINYEKLEHNVKLYSLASLIQFPANYLIRSNAIGPRECEELAIYHYDEDYRVVLIKFSDQLVFLLLIDKNNKQIDFFSNKKEIRDWTKAYTQIDDDSAWLVKYNLGYVFKDLKIKGNKIYLLTSDGGTGSTGGFNIEHVFTVKNGKPVTLVSRFIPNPQKEKAIKAMMESK